MGHILDELKEYLSTSSQEQLDADWEELKYLNEYGPFIKTNIMESEFSLLGGDCVSLMNMLIKQGVKVDLTITSPPYDNLRNYNGEIEWNEEIWKQIIDKLYSITKQGGVVVWVVGDATIEGSETGTSFKQALYFKEVGFNLHDTMIYQKSNPVPVGGNNRYYQHFEYMFIFSKGKPITFNPILRERINKWGDKRTERIKSFNRNKDGDFTKKKVSLIGKVKLGNIWNYIVGGGNSVEYGIKHPAVFPEKLAHDHIISWSNKGDLVFDPMMGSGTVGKEAIILNRNFIGIEKVNEYFFIAKQRIIKAKSELTLFDKQ